MITLTPQAASELRGALQSKGLTGFGLRVQIVGGGCEGFLYDLVFVDGPDPEDRVFETEGHRIFVDPRSLPILEGLVIDHAKTARGVGFVFSNPRARKACSCGASFSA